MDRTTYKVFSLGVGVLGGLAAKQAFQRLWAVVSPDDEAPNPLEPDHTWQQVLVAAAFEGVVYALVKATVERSAAIGVKRATGTWPAR